MDGAAGNDYSNSWRAQAHCACVPDPEIFFPDRNASADEALAICGGCPVMFACRAYAIEHQERDGVWGGLTESERRQVVAASESRRTRRRPSSWTGVTRRRIGA
jgi:WhiB family redox-sensing transcriptional regulator